MAENTSVKPSIRLADHRYVAADTFAFRMSDNGAQITFGLETSDATGKEYVQQEVTVVLTLRSLKVLQLLATAVVGGYEKNVEPIKIPPEKEAQLSSIKITLPPPKPA